MEWESDRSWCSHTYPGQGHRSPGRCSGWELEFRDWGAIPGQGLLLTVERQIKGMWGRRCGTCGGKCLWRKAGQPWKQRNTAESCVVGGAITIASLRTCQHQQLNNRDFPIIRIRPGTSTQYISRRIWGSEIPGEENIGLGGKFTCILDWNSDS